MTNVLPFRILANPVDLHAPDVDPTGRVDVLLARALRMVALGSGDPVLRSLYVDLGPVVDTAIHHLTRKLGMAGLLREYGIAPPSPKPTPIRKRKAKAKATATTPTPTPNGRAA